MIGESHKFRNCNTNMYITLTEYLDLVNARTGYYPFIGLLAASNTANIRKPIEKSVKICYIWERSMYEYLDATKHRVGKST